MHFHGVDVTSLESSRQTLARILTNKVLDRAVDEGQKYPSRFGCAHANLFHHFDGDVDQSREIWRGHQRRRVIQRFVLCIYHETVTAEVANDLLAEPNGGAITLNCKVNLCKRRNLMSLPADRHQGMK